MRLLADENFPKEIVVKLRTDGHDVLWARTDRVRWDDSDLLDLAEAESRVLLTLDKDFWQIAIQRKTPLKKSGVVLFRVHPATVENLIPLVRVLFMAGSRWAGLISVVTREGVQMVSSRG